MNFSERVANDPLGAVSACLVWVPVTIWIVSVVGWMVSAEVDVLAGVAAIGAAMGLGVMTAYPPDPRLSPVFFAAAIVTVVVYPFAKVAVNRHELAMIDIEQIDKQAELLRQKPNNFGAMLKLAELLYKRGMPAHAIALGERALEGMPANLFRPEHNMVSAWKMQTVGPGFSRSLPCLRCHELNTPESLYCTACGYPYVTELAKGRLLGPNAGRQIIAVWICVMVVIVGLPSAARLADRSPVLAVVTIIGLVAVALTVLLRTFLKGGHHQTT